MQRTVSEVQIGNKTTRFKIRIEDTPVPEGQLPGWRLIQFMEALVASPDLLNCGFSKPQVLKFYFSGAHWVAEGEATVQE